MGSILVPGGLREVRDFPAPAPRRPPPRGRIILILRDAGDYKYFLQLNSALVHGGLEGKIKTWVYPNDFPYIAPAAQARVPRQPAACQ